MNSVLRNLLMLLSFPYSYKNNLSNRNDSKIYKVILKQLSSIKITDKNIKKTHLEFNKKIRNILVKKELTNFLKIGFLQKIFFVHNRLFIFFELLELKKKKLEILQTAIKRESCRKSGTLFFVSR